MWKYRRTLNQSLLLLSNRNSFSSRTYNPSKPLKHYPIVHPNLPILFSYSTLGPLYSDDHEFKDYGKTLVFSKHCDKKSVEKCELERDVGTIMAIIGPVIRDYSAVRTNLDKCDLSISPELVTEVLSRVRNNWKSAFTFFQWARKHPDHTLSVRDYHCLISILGKARRFNAAWALVNEMKKGGVNGGESMVTAKTLLMMIRRYSAVHDVDKAIKTFYAHSQFNLQVGVHEFRDLLSALCRYKNVKEAEVLLKRNKDVYALTTKSCNIILNGWCNVICSPREGKRVWWEMCRLEIPRDVVSYSTIISCYSKCNETKEVIKIYNELKGSAVKADIMIYNGVIHAFLKSGFEKEAREVMRSMKENGFHPNAVTYNSMIMPFCKKGRILDAFKMFDEMLQRGLVPTNQTYHSFFCAARTSKEALSILQKMNEMGCIPNHDTYNMLVRKFCRWDEFENVWKLWDEMVRNGLDPDRSSYVALVNGLFLNGKLEEAYKYYVEMKSKGLLPEPEMEERLQGWMAAKKTTEQLMVGSEAKCGDG